MTPSSLHLPAATACASGLGLGLGWFCRLQTPAKYAHNNWQNAKANGEYHARNEINNLCERQK